MTVDLHYISKHGLNHHRLGDNMYESGEWIASDELASEAVGGFAAYAAARPLHERALTINQKVLGPLA